MPIVAHDNTGWADQIAGLVPGDHVAVLSTRSGTGLRGRLAGLELRDTLFVLSPRAMRFVFLFRKPLSEPTVAEQVLKTGTGALRIDACRVNNGVAKQATAGRRTVKWGVGEGGSSYEKGTGAIWSNEGRWPSNFILVHGTACRNVGTKHVRPSPSGTRTTALGIISDDNWKAKTQKDSRSWISGDVPSWECEPACPVAQLDAQSGTSASRIGQPRGSAEPGQGWGMTKTGAEYDDVGGASRFFPQFEDDTALLAWLHRLVGC
jgi:hypothetical protein